MQNDSFKMRQHYAPYNRSEESHRASEEYVFYGKPPSREIASLRSQRQYIRLVDSSVGYFAALNMTYFFLHVILNEVKNPTE